MSEAGARITLYERRSCSTCKRARVALVESGAEFATVDIFRTRLSVDDLRRLLGSTPVADAFSWKSPQAKMRGIMPGMRNDSELLALMAEEPRLIRRPLVRIGDRLIIGADLPQIASLVSGSA